MKFISVAVLAVLVCAVTVYAVPSPTIDDDSSILFDAQDLAENTDKTIQKLRRSIGCTVFVFGKFAQTGVTKVFGKLFTQYKSDAEKLITKLKSCATEKNHDLKAECTKTVYIGYIYTVARLDCKMENINSILGYQVMHNLKHYCAMKNDNLFELDEF